MIIIEFLFLWVVKFVDNLINTSKSILLYKGRYFLSAILVFISTIIFCLIVGKIARGNDIEVVLIIASASAVGSYISGILSEYFEKDKTLISIMTCNNKQSLLELHNYLTINKIKHILLPTYTLEKEKETLTILVICKTKHESKLFDTFVNESSEKFLQELFN